MELKQHLTKMYTGYKPLLKDTKNTGYVIEGLKKDIDSISEDKDVQLNPHQEKFFDTVKEILAEENRSTIQMQELLELINNHEDYSSAKCLEEVIKTLKCKGFDIKT